MRDKLVNLEIWEAGMVIEVRKAHRRELTRNELFGLVWEKPMTKVGDELGISDVAVRKICVKHNIPRPPQGHWASGSPASPPKSLPPVPAHMEKISIYVPEKVVGRPEAFSNLNDLPGKIAAVIEKGVPTRLGHGLGATNTELRRGEVDRYGYCRPAYQRSTHDVIATRASLKRALYLMEYIFRLCEAAGYSIKSDQCSRNRWSMSSWVCRDDVRISIRIKSAVKQVLSGGDRDQSNFHKYEYIDTGRLSLTIGDGSTVRENEGRHLEDAMPEIYRKIVTQHEAQKARRRQWDMDERQRKV